MEKDERLITLKKVLTEVDAISLRDFLIHNGVEACIISYYDSTFDGISQNWGKGWWGEIQVLQHNSEKAEQLLSEFEAQEEK